MWSEINKTQNKQLKNSVLMEFRRSYRKQHPRDKKMANAIYAIYSIS